MERIEAEEKAAREAEEKAAREVEEQRRAEEQRIEEEKRREEEKKIAEEKKLAEEKRVIEEQKKQQELVERRRQEELAEQAAAEAEDEHEQNAAYAKLVEENKKEKERAAKELEERRKQPSKPHRVNVEIPVSTSSPRRRTFKSKAIISDDSSDEVVEQPKEVVPRGTKRKRTIKMVARSGNDNESNADPTPETAVVPPESSSQPQHRSPCSRCVLVGKTADCRPQNASRPTQACRVCHQQRQRCSWSGDNVSRRSRGKRVKVDDEVYEGPAARVGERRFEGPGIAEQLAAIVDQNKDLIDIARRSLVLQERMLHLMVIRERREEAREEVDKSEDEDEDEDEDGEGEIDEEEKERNDEEKKRREIREGKKRAE
ncbi:hypothetical protein F5890DRAFT_1560513 [Lentinula detonsa]|uniref:Uncharacterized protein n=1 Tax=Lentinula detonsa TaxID=2804962 RepID=A0AA38PMV2_9AGAR|nr:hypothetical protein F5890DRAFT_1560513 [Lentinula detonsa]